MILSAHQPQYLLWLGYLDKIKNSDVFVFLDNVQYKKREFQNRNKIRTSEGWIWLTVPVISKERFFQKISEVEINNSIDWADSHLRSIELNYSKSPHFRDYIDFFRKTYQAKWNKLIDVNVHIITAMLEILNIRTPVCFEETLNIKSKSTQRIIDICNKLNADTYLSGVGAKEYLDEGLFKKHSIKLIYQEFIPPVYKQIYAGFEPNMSCVDYLLCQGNRKW